MMTAISVLRLIAASAGPDRARYRARSRSASRIAIGLRLPVAATTDRSAGASSTMATLRAMKPTASSSVWLLLPPPLPDVAPAAPSSRNAPTRKQRPIGIARWRVFLGAGGGAASAAPIGSLPLVFAGRRGAREGGG